MYFGQVFHRHFGTYDKTGKVRPRYARKARDRVFPLETSIHNRPDEVNDRSQFCNWEGDLMIFERAQGNANVATLIERKTRYTLLLRNNDRKSRPLMNKLINEMSPLPAAASPLTGALSSRPGVNCTKAWAPNPGSVIRKHHGKKARLRT
jgi:IS30 family transposase